MTKKKRERDRERGETDRKTDSQNRQTDFYRVVEKKRQKAKNPSL